MAKTPGVPHAFGCFFYACFDIDFKKDGNISADCKSHKTLCNRITNFLR